MVAARLRGLFRHVFDVAAAFTEASPDGGGGPQTDTVAKHSLSTCLKLRGATNEVEIANRSIHDAHVRAMVQLKVHREYV